MKGYIEGLQNMLDLGVKSVFQLTRYGYTESFVPLTREEQQRIRNEIQEITKATKP